MDVNDEQKIAGADGTQPAAAEVVSAGAEVPAVTEAAAVAGVAAASPDAPIEEPPADPDEEEAPVEEPPERHEQNVPIEEPEAIAAAAVVADTSEAGADVVVASEDAEPAVAADAAVADGPESVEVVVAPEDAEPAVAAEAAVADGAEPAEAVATPEDVEPAVAADAAVSDGGDPVEVVATPEDGEPAVAVEAAVADGAEPTELEAAAEDIAAEESGESDAELHQVMSAEEVMGGQSTEQASAVDVDEANLRAIVEAIVYVTEEPLTLDQIAAALEQTRERVAEALRQIIEHAADSGRGITVREVAGGFKMGTKPEHHDAIRTFVKKLKPPLKLSLAALQNLAVIAYKQPITAPEIMEVRGVQGAGVIKTLLDRKLIQPAGRKAVVGKPILYKTTKEFLLQFGLKDLSELPTLKEFEELRRLAFSDDEPVAEPVKPEAPPAQAAAAE